MSFAKIYSLRSSARLRNLSSILNRSENVLNIVFCKHSSSTGDAGSAKVSTTVKIGTATIEVQPAKNPELVPLSYLPENLSQTILQHLKWIMQKDKLGQDIFLIGPPGSFRRSLAMMYLELTNREIEYVSLSRDTTESDLKQRREIVAGSALHFDQSAVRAAIRGRVLVLEGIEKAERNVLPILNNLLENREMQLDDGRFLMAPERYDQLLDKYGSKELSEWRLVRCSDRFRVIALGLPVPRFRGNPLDPPLRSRFQGRDTSSMPYEETLSEFNKTYTNVKPERLMQLLSFSHAVTTKEATSVGLPDFPVDNLSAAFTILNHCPSLSNSQVLSRLYPYKSFLGHEGSANVEELLKRFEVLDQPNDTMQIKSVAAVSDAPTTEVTIEVRKDPYTFQVPVGERFAAATQRPEETDFVGTPYLESQLADLLLTHSVGDFCLLGPRGCGKSVLVHELARRLGYPVDPVMLYADMSSRDLLQQRYTVLETGDTAWRLSSLVNAAVAGRLALLDGLHRVNPGTLAVLHRLIVNRELDLFDGTRLLRHDRYDRVKEANGWTDGEMKARGVLRIDPRFRIVALAEPPAASGGVSQSSSAGQQWLTPELLTSFLFHTMRPLDAAEEGHVVGRLVPDCSQDTTRRLIDYVHTLRASADPTLQSLAGNLSTRQVIRIARRLAKYPEESLDEAIHKACLSKFLPKLAQGGLQQSLVESNLAQDKENKEIDNVAEESPVCERRDGTLRLGDVTVELPQIRHEMKIPDVVFYDSVLHLRVLEAMLKDFLLGEHLLLVGNQGVGKNKIVDRFLHLLNRPREYVQLHRDTTVQSLTLQPSVQEGVLVYEDSPLVRAVTLGHVLVVDEADKAPTHVTCVLKTLVEAGEMELADGRRIIPASRRTSPKENVLVTHPDFRMIVLANRPGFPFLGNDFFGAMGDVFSCLAVDNPDLASEVEMLRKYGPDVPEASLRRLAGLFSELRALADEGQIQYPYSTRELVNIVKHLQKYPSEGLSTVVRNVFDFDAYNQELRTTLENVLDKHGIPMAGGPGVLSLAKELALPPLKLTGHWEVMSDTAMKAVSLIRLPVETRSMTVKGPVPLPRSDFDLEHREARTQRFSELESYWSIPLEEYNTVGDIGVTRATEDGSSDVLHVASLNPVTLHSMAVGSRKGSAIDVSEVFPNVSGVFKPRIRLAALGPPFTSHVLMHEAATNILLSINTKSGELMRILSDSFPEKHLKRRMWPITADSSEVGYEMCTEWSQELPESFVVFYEKSGSALEVCHLIENSWHSISLPFRIKKLYLVDKNEWIAEEAGEKLRKYIISRTSFFDLDYTLRPITEKGPTLNTKATTRFVSSEGYTEQHLKSVVPKSTFSPNRIMMDSESYAQLLVGIPNVETSVEVYTCDKETADKEQSDSNRNPQQKKVSSQISSTFLPSSGLLVNSVPPEHVSPEVWDPKVPIANMVGFLEVVDLPRAKLRYLPVTNARHQLPYLSWLRAGLPDVYVASTAGEDLLTVDQGGSVMHWQVVHSRLDTALADWRRVLGEESDRELMLERDVSGSDMSLSGPKHGKLDPTGAPHVGGNTWAGGTGGRDTAGLGGVGGPYRLDAGTDVHQVPDSVKQAVPEHIRAAAREMAQKAWRQRLKEIEMSEFDAQLYESYASKVQGQVSAIRAILDTLQAKSKERQWLRHQTQGDLDDGKLIEGLVGEKAVYKRRGDKEPEPGAPQMKPKHLRLVADVSGSMYRFNGHDKRLERQMEALLMLMEAFAGHTGLESKLKWDLYGHSGEGPQFPFIPADNPPVNDKQRLDVLKGLLAHSQFCMSGDHTLEAVTSGIAALAEEDADQRFLVILSDANLSRYGIHPRQLGRLLTSNPSVYCCVVFIGSLGDQAHSLTKSLPSGHAFVCLDTKMLPQILQQIFTTTVLSSDI